MPRDEGLALLDELEAFATRPERVYAHRWEQGDAVFWDNRSTMHSATPYDMTRYRRVMYRTTIAGDVPY
jgi:alpha-ketoglutarate-dependent taurine dioxygenase